MRLPRLPITLRLCLLALVGIGLHSCTDSTAGPEDFAPVPLEMRKPPADDGTSEDPVVSAVDPSVVPQDTIVNLVISGENFAQESDVEFEIGGVVSTKLKTNSVRVSRNGRSLTANVTVDADAEIAFYDVAVVSIGRGRRGIGTQLLEVQKSNKPAEPTPMSTTMPGTVTSGASNELLDDGLGAFVGGECSIESSVSELGPTSAFSDMWYSFRAPNGDRLKGKALREARECNDFPRNVVIDITGETLVHTGARGDHSGDVLLSTLIGTGPGIPQNPEIIGTRSGSFSAWVPERGTPTIDGTHILGERSSFNAPYCFVPGGGPPMIFTTSREPDSDDLLFSFTGSIAEQGFTFSTRPYPDNVGHCTSFDSDGDAVILLLHLDLSYRVSPISGLPSS